ncbi:MAG: hypothetical protein RI907_736 [Pseudomonadota bacterium]|jgi:hypothetical protein
MWIVAVAWMYIAVMMALAEGTNPNGTWLGAAVTFVMYGLAPLSLVMYLLGAPGRRKRILARERAEHAAHPAEQAQPAPQATPAGPSPTDSAPATPPHQP